MGSEQPLLLAAAYLLGMLLTSCLGLHSQEGPGNEDEPGKEPAFQVRLIGTNSQCQGQLEVRWSSRDSWHAVCRQSWGRSKEHWEGSQQASAICQQLGCGSSLVLAHFSSFTRSQRPVTCHGALGTFSNCSRSTLGLCLPLALVCLEPPRTTPPPTSPPPTTTPEPTAPPRLQLVAGPLKLQCAGLVEFYSGSLGGTVSYGDRDPIQDLGNLVCGAVGCGSFLKHLPEVKTEEAADLWDGPLPIRWRIQNSSCASLEQCFQKTRPQDGGRPLALVCSGFQPKVQSRLVGGHGVCAGTAEVRQGGQWTALCDTHGDRGRARWEELCQAQQCGSLVSHRVLDPSKTASGLFCSHEKLSQCHELQEKRTSCKRVFVTCQDPNPAGLAAGTVVSIVLALVLLVVLLVVCGPLAYKKLVKKFRQKKQRQWIGPTGMNQNVSFHRNHTATVRSQVENPTASSVDNEYSQPPTKSHLSAYPALEGALQRSSTQPDNSSDSDYDLHVAQRL